MAIFTSVTNKNLNGNSTELFGPYIFTLIPTKASIKLKAKMIPNKISPNCVYLFSSDRQEPSKAHGYTLKEY